MLPPSLEEEANVQGSWVPSAGGIALPRVGSIGLAPQIPARHGAREKLGFKVA